MWRATLVSLLAVGMSFAQRANPGVSFAGPQFSAEQAAAAEAALAADPEDIPARLNLLSYYWAQSNTPNGNRAARTNHLLWLIENHPELGVFRMPEASLPDPEDRERIQQAWGQALATHSNDARVLSNAAWIYESSDRRQSVDLLRRALALNPADRQIAGQLGYEYAGILAGVKELHGSSGLPRRFDPAEVNSALAQSVRVELEQSTQAAVVYSAGGALNGFIAQAKQENVDLSQLAGLAGKLTERAKAIEPALAPQRIRVGGNVQAANLVKKVDPSYPLLAAQARIQGVVKFSVIVGKDGTVQNLQVISGHPLLIEPAVEAVKQWEYKPTLLNGLPVEVVTQIDVNFALQPVTIQP